VNHRGATEQNRKALNYWREKPTTVDPTLRQLSTGPRLVCPLRESEIHVGLDKGQEETALEEREILREWIELKYERERALHSSLRRRGAKEARRQ